MEIDYTSFTSPPFTHTLSVSQQVSFFTPLILFLFYFNFLFPFHFFTLRSPPLLSHSFICTGEMKIFSRLWWQNAFATMRRKCTHLGTNYWYSNLIAEALALISNIVNYSHICSGRDDIFRSFFFFFFLSNPHFTYKCN